MRIELHASCAARDGAGVLLLGPSGMGKSDLLLRLFEHGFDLVADDRVVIENGIARAAPGGEGLLEVRGLGILRVPYLEEVSLRLIVRLTRSDVVRLPSPDAESVLGIPALDLDPSSHTAAARVRLAIDCLLGRVGQCAGFLAD